jgi:hypothetical protein
LTFKRQQVLAAPLPAPGRCQLQGRAGSVKAGFAYTFAGQFDGCGCPARTDGLDGFWPTTDNIAAGADQRALWYVTFRATQGVFLLFAPADRRWRRRSGSASGSGGVRAVAAARAAQRAALKPYRKFSHGSPAARVLSRLMLDTLASSDA